MIDLIVAPGVEEVAVIKASQVGVSAALRWFIAKMAADEPDPAGLALPDKEKGEQIVTDRVRPMFREIPALKTLATGNFHDEKKQQIKLANGFNLYLMWSGSRSSMASNPIRFIVGDEVDKWAPWPGGEAHGVYLLRRRLRTYGRRARAVWVSTPTTPEGMISVLWRESTVRLHYVIACPHCGARQRLVFDRLKWERFEGVSGVGLDREARAAKMIAENAAWYECGGCSGRITDRQKNAALQPEKAGGGGAWATCDGRGMADGVIEDASKMVGWPRGTKIGLSIPSLLCTWDSFARIAARFIEAQGDYAKMMDFRQNDQAEPFERQVKAESTSDLSARCSASNGATAEGLLPEWTARLLMSIDTQKDHFWFVVRAFGPGFLSQRILHGRVQSFEDLDRLIYRTSFAFAGREFAPMAVEMAGIDSGGTKNWNASDAAGNTAATPSRVMEVYAWALQRQNRVRVIKGDSAPKPGQFIRRATGAYVAGSGGPEAKVPLWLLDVHHYQDELAWLMEQQVERVAPGSVNQETGEVEVVSEPLWRLNLRDDDEYNQHLANMHKVARRERGAGGRVVERWEPRSSAARVDLRACEGYLVALADMAGVRVLPDIESWRAQRDAEHARARQPAGKPFTTPDGRPFLASQR